MDRTLSPRHLECFRTATGTQYRISRALQNPARQLPDLLIIIHYEHDSS